MFVLQLQTNFQNLLANKREYNVFMFAYQLRCYQRSTIQYFLIKCA